MKFTVGPYVYRLVIEELSSERLGGVKRGSRVVVISTKCPSDEALPTLLHELWHAWRDVFPVAFDNDESEAEFYGNMVTQVHRELAKQGGETALLRMIRAAKPTESNEPPEGSEDPDVAYDPKDPWVWLPRAEKAGAKTGRTGQRARCMGCDRVWGAPFLITCASRFDGACAGWVVDRQLYCPCCNQLRKWTEGVTPWGAPNGELAYEAVVASSKDCQAFLKQHPDIEQASREIDEAA